VQLTSAETVAYSEQPAVDRAAVARYKAFVHGNVATVKSELESLLRSVAQPV
jgi:hypothetical protein